MNLGATALTNCTRWNRSRQSGEPTIEWCESFRLGYFVSEFNVDSANTYTHRWSFVMDWNRRGWHDRHCDCVHCRTDSKWVIMFKRNEMRKMVIFDEILHYSQVILVNCRQYIACKPPSEQTNVFDLWMKLYLVFKWSKCMPGRFRLQI